MCNHQVVGLNEVRKQVALLITLVNSVLDDLGRILMEVIEAVGRHDASNSRGDSLASISDEVLNGEQVLALLFISAVNLEGPSVGKTEEELSMVRSLDLDNVSHEVRTHEKGKSLDLVLLFGLSTRKSDE